jgi:hypothetical protein
MFADWLRGSDLLVWPLVGLAIFFVAFLIVLARVAFGMRGTQVSRVASLPLADDERIPGEGRAER